MLQSLRISHFAIIDELDIEFNDDMTVLTGETGAGKSIIIDAIGQLLGQRANAGMVKSGYDKALIEGVFDISNHPVVQEKLEDLGFDVDDDLVVSKQITSAGKSTCRLNYRIVNISILKEIIPLMIDIHSQFETQYLLNSRIHIDLLDRYCEKSLIKLKTQYKEAFKDYIAKEKELKSLMNQPSDEEQLEFYQFQVQEIEDANILDNELEDLEQEKKRLDEFEKTNQILTNFINEVDGQYGALPQLQSAMHFLDSLSEQSYFEPLYAQYEEGFYKIQDAYEQIKDYFNHFEFDDYRFQEIQERIYTIQRIQKKYGYSIEKINGYKEDLMNKIEMIENREYFMANLENTVNQAKKACLEIAKKIHNVRKKHAKKLENQIMQQLKDLYMDKSTFEVSITQTENIHKNGFDEIVFMISTNIGQELRPLNQIASGGELSRLMLGLKCIFTSINQTSTIIFDEVDTGVSGKVAASIGNKMKTIAKNVQVLCITHLPQVASCAKHHLFVYKFDDKKTTYTNVKYLENNDRVEEIAKMLSSDEISETSLNNARELLKINGNILIE